MKILIIGASGMIGSALIENFSAKDNGVLLYGTVRSPESLKRLASVFDPSVQLVIFKEPSFINPDGIASLLCSIKPDVVINCIGLIKQNYSENRKSEFIKLNALFPHLLYDECFQLGIRLIQISTDCVFNGKKGNYSEDDLGDANDVYGLTKYLGEINAPNALTIRTSCIGPEISSHIGLLEWFLAQKNEVQGFKHAIYSGLTTHELATVLMEFILPNLDLQGLFHISSSPISKYDLLVKIAKRFNKAITIHPNEEFVVDRTLNSSKFFNATGYKAPSWDEMLDKLKTGN
jgi:dTDP-4-dehydrorhamnose reductase